MNSFVSFPAWYSPGKNYRPRVSDRVMVCQEISCCGRAGLGALHVELEELAREVERLVGSILAASGTKIDRLCLPGSVRSAFAEWSNEVGSRPVVYSDLPPQRCAGWVYEVHPPELK